MHRRILSLLCPLFLLAIVVSSALVFTHATPRAHAATAISIDTTSTLTTNGAFQGFGLQEDTNMLWTTPNHTAGAVVPDDYNTYVKPRLAAMQPAFVRKFIDVGWFAPSQGSYTWNSTDMQGLYTDLQALKDDQVTVLLTIWRIPPWLTASANGFNTENQTAGSFPTAGSSPNYDDLWSTVITDLLKHLYGTDGSGYSFTNIRYLCAPNELESEHSISRLDNPYTLLHNKLSSANLTSQVTLFGPDYYTPDALNTAKNDSTLNPLLGFYDYHEYDNPVEPTFINNISTETGYASGTGKQVWLTEFNDSSSGSNNWTLLPSFAIDGLNHGLAALSVWDAQDQIYDTNAILDNGKWGLWGFKDSNYQPKTSYYTWSNLTAHTAANSSVYHNSCDREQCSNLRVAALADAQQHQTLLAYNLDANNSQTLTFSYTGSSPSQTLYRYLINPSSLPNPAAAGNLLGYDETISMTNGTFTDTLPAGAFAVYSSRNPIAPTSTSNLALSATVTASSSAPYTGWSLANVHDGIRTSTSSNSGWSSNNQVNSDHSEWLQFDLGSNQSFNKMDFYLPNTNGQASSTGYGMPINFTIDVSNDAQNWSSVVTQTNYPAPDSTALQSFPFPTQNARYVRIFATSLRQSSQDYNLYRMQFAEVELYDVAPISSLAFTPTASSSAPYTGWSLDNVHDGQETSTSSSQGWSSNNQVNSDHTEWLQLDLGSPKSVYELDFLLPNTNGQVNPTSSYGMPINFTIDASLDGQNWTNLITRTNYPAPTTTPRQSFLFSIRQARYLRIVGTSLRQSSQDYNLYRMQFAEAEVF